MVFLGGALGSSARHGIGLLASSDALVPWDIAIVNVAGALLMGLLVGRLGRISEGRARRLRLLLGTGVLGGFTTYSALAVDTAVLARDQHWVAALGYPLGSVVLGLLACGLGLTLGARAPGRGRLVRSDG